MSGVNGGSGFNFAMGRIRGVGRETSFAKARGTFGADSCSGSLHGAVLLSEEAVWYRVLLIEA